MNIILDKNSANPLYRQLSDALQALIEDGTLAPDVKLPPIRTMAKNLDVNTITVVSAYKNLEIKKLVYSTIGSGTYVSKITAQPLPVQANENKFTIRAENASGMINFADSATDSSLFPVGAFRRAFEDVLEKDGGAAFDYHDSRGYYPLREQLCEYLDESSVKAQSENIQIISGAQQGLDILAKTLLGPGDAALIEQPAFYGAAGAFASRGARIYEMPMLSDGPDMDKAEALIKQYRPKCVYVMPNFQTPTGVSYSAEKKRRLLELAYQNETYIIEDDNQNDFYYDGKRRVPLKALDYRNRVVYIKSFSKILMPGLRIGFMALPMKLAVTTAKRNTDVETSGFIQRAFDAYLRSGGFSDHGYYIRAKYGMRYRTVLSAINENLSYSVSFTPPGGGLSFWLSPLNEKWVGNTDELCEAIAEKGVLMTPGNVFSAGCANFFRISFAAAPENKLAEGIAAAAAVIRS